MKTKSNFMKPFKLNQSGSRSFLFTLAFASCVSAAAQIRSTAPVGNHFESASTVDKGNLKLGFSYSKSDIHLWGESSKLNYNIGATVAYGVSDYFDVSITYANMSNNSDLLEEGESFTTNYFCISPKINAIDKYLSVKFPLAMYLSSEMENIFTAAPALVGTLPIGNKFDVTAIVDYEVSIHEDFENMLGFALGLGVSTDFDVWALRPEVGYQINTREAYDLSFLTYGVALNYNFNLKK
jgi:hypothetical protein